LFTAAAIQPLASSSDIVNHISGLDIESGSLVPRRTAVLDSVRQLLPIAAVKPKNGVAAVRGRDAISRALQRIQGDFVEIPGLHLTAAQAQRVWGLERDVCDALLGALVDAKFLAQTPDGSFIRLGAMKPSAMLIPQRKETSAIV
jgi:hypothetical protein